MCNIIINKYHNNNVKKKLKSIFLYSDHYFNLSELKIYK